MTDFKNQQGNKSQQQQKSPSSQPGSAPGQQRDERSSNLRDSENR